MINKNDRKKETKIAGTLGSWKNFQKPIWFLKVASGEAIFNWGDKDMQW